MIYYVSHRFKNVLPLNQRWSSLYLLSKHGDSNFGFDRLKNGYVVDDFTDHTVGAVFSPDYKCSLDFREGQLRPQHYTTNVA